MRQLRGQPREGNRGKGETERIRAESNTLQRQNNEISKQIFPEKEYRGLSPNFHIHVSMSDLIYKIK
jgi:hypothetical protein